MKCCNHSQSCFRRQCHCMMDHGGCEMHANRQSEGSITASSTSSSGNRGPQNQGSQVEMKMKLCGCGRKALLLTSRSQMNPGRRFYRCPLWRDQRSSCGFFEWIDDTDTEELNKIVEKLMKQVEMLKCVCFLLGVLVVILLWGRLYF